MHSIAAYPRFATLPALRRALLVGAVTLLGCGDQPLDPVVPEPSLPDVAIVSPITPSFSTGVVDAPVVLSVRVDDEVGAPLASIDVEWVVGSGGGAIVSSPTSTTDATGHASSVWRLGQVATRQSATARVRHAGGVETVRFEVDALPGPAARATLVADSVLLSARGETAFLAPSLADAFGNEVDDAPSLSWSSRDPSVAMVAADGLVTGVDAGSTWVVASLDEPTDSILVTLVSRGAVTITFDDGWRTTYEQAYPLFLELGLPANVAVNPGVVTFPAYMDVTQLHELHDAGWSMVSHTMSHANLTTLSDAELDYELRESRAFLEGQGFRGADLFVVPFHDWGARERDVVARHYRVARGVAVNYFPQDSLVQWMPSNPYDLTGFEADDLPYTTVEGRERLRGLLQRATERGEFFDLFFHQVPPENVEALRETLAIVAEYRDRVLPYHELYPVFARDVR